MREFESFSSLSLFKRCPRAYEFRYIKGIKTPPAGAMILGSATHEGLEQDMRYKIAEQVNMRTETVLDIFSDSFDRRSQEDDVDWGKDKSGQLKDSGISAISRYHSCRSMELDPKMVEQKFELSLSTPSKPTSIKIIGYIDLIETDNSLLDWKTGSKKKSEKDVSYSEQLLMYQLAVPEVSELRLETILRYKTKAPDYQVLSRPPASDNELAMVRENI